MKKDNCTAMLVGKDASIDGSTMIARDEDGYAGINEKLFVVNKAKHYDENYVSKYNGFKMHLEGDGCKWTAAPTADSSEGRWDEQGINEYNVAMTATETEATNARCLGHDPLVKNGINEDAMLYITLPFVKTAREGVKRLGQLIEKYGTGETNGIAFSDNKEIWYFETGAGHQWVAARVPDDSYAICPNIMVIQKIDFDDPDNFMFASTIRDFVKKNHLNNSNDGSFNFRNIFGTQDEADAFYNTPRIWYGQKLFNPSIEQDPTSQEMPFTRKPERKIGIEDVQKFLTSHYNGTPYDPMDTYSSGDKKDQKKFRSITLDRNQESSILQIRNNVPSRFAAIQWINMGFYAYSPYVPFYTNIEDTPLNYKIAEHTVDPDNSAYWLYKTLQVLVEPRFHQYVYQVNAYRDDCQSYGIGRVEKTDQAAEDMDQEELVKYLTTANDQTAGVITKKTKALMSDLIRQALNSSKYQFERGDNL
ncbi:C69 family dipeptidase [Lactobacillus acetotolerans]|uniref:C69 family dipeptidase n=1 Tax=Lactobacillus acetotolerans TaxID=1600 RepID=UPI0019D251CF|nr:C69 family dipeptidase [Lactobacillus acetotolerans]MBN7276429.1 C69 family dipeptidase [Lactobacillus acetotolerans]